MMERANPTRFFMPPLRFTGIFACSPSNSITSNISFTFARMTSGSRSPASRKGKAMFSSTVIESKSAPP